MVGGTRCNSLAMASAVKRFVEKPSYTKASRYVKNKNFYWNGGIFTWRAGVFIDTMERYSPDFSRRLDLKRLVASYGSLPALSIDYALLEKAKNIVLYRTDMDWCDLGSWDMLLEKSKREHGYYRRVEA